MEKSINTAKQKRSGGLQKYGSNLSGDGALDEIKGRRVVTLDG